MNLKCEWLRAKLCLSVEVENWGLLPQCYKRTFDRYHNQYLNCILNIKRDIDKIYG